MRGKRSGLRRVRRGILDELQLELTAGLNDLPSAGRIALTRKLDEDFIVVAAVELNGRLGQTQGVDAALERFERLLHGLLLDGDDGGGAQREQVAGGFAGRGGHVPFSGELIVHKVAELGGLFGSDIADEELRVAYAADLIVMNVLGAELRGEAVNRLVGFLADGFLHLHLENEVRAALQIEPELDLVAEILLHLRPGRRK